ncbi:unnamed protein product [Pleuronectes platessa]|uniref:Uncharacterized protein n=1 Tax=Pleuronectes platessa TaxID=8262 RepID=A0A9N7U540_PLEPL|nr:unnamed protein product [Pleuronectes platessa]
MTAPGCLSEREGAWGERGFNSTRFPLVGGDENGRNEEKRAFFSSVMRCHIIRSSTSCFTDELQIWSEYCEKNGLLIFQKQHCYGSCAWLVLTNNWEAQMEEEQVFGAYCQTAGRANGPDVQ